MLPADKHFLDLLKINHNVELSQDDLKTLNEFHFKLKLENQSRLANDLNSVYYDISNGKVLTILAFAVVGFFVAPLFGISGIVGALIAASIGWRVVGGLTNPPNAPPPAPTFGYNSVPSIVPIGNIVPLVFCNRDINLLGGARTSGAIINSRVDTFSGIQRLCSMYVLSVGEIGEIDTTQVLINNQPTSNFFPGEIESFFVSGTLTQTIPSNFFVNYSQTQTVSDNNGIGLSKVGYASTNLNNTTTIRVGDVTTQQNFTPSNRYLFNGQYFKVTGTYTNINYGNNTGDYRVYSDTNLTGSDSIPFLSYYRTRYKTSKKCTEIWLNFSATLYAYDNNNTYVNFGLINELYIDGVFICMFYMQNGSQVNIRRRLIVKNLPFSFHTIETNPISKYDGSKGSIYPLYPDGYINYVYPDTNPVINGQAIIIGYERNPGVLENTDDANSRADFYGKASTSADGQVPCTMTTVCEIVSPSDLGQSQFTNYPGLAIAGLNILASSRLQGDPNPNWFINKGIIGRTHIAANIANSASNNNILYDLTANFASIGLSNNLILRNLDNQTESYIVSWTNTSVTTDLSLLWQAGNRYLIYGKDSLVYFPDIYVWTLTSKQGGLGGILPGTILADYFIDYPNIVRSRQFCIQNNFYWDGGVDKQTQWMQWVNTESMASLLFPAKYGGRFGLLPEVYTEPVALFNATNIIENTYTEDYAPKQLLNCVHVVYKDGTNYSDPWFPDNDIKFYQKNVSILTEDAYNGTTQIFPESITLDSVTNEQQAIRVGQVYLKTRLLQSRVISFSTSLQGFSVREGDLIIVQHVTTEVDKESSGFVTAINVVSSGVNQVQLSSPLQIGLTSDYSCSILKVQTGTFQNNLACQVVQITTDDVTTNWLEISGLQDNLSATVDNFSGDYVVVGRDIPDRRTYRVSQINPADDGSVAITAILWVADMLTANGLYTVD